MVLLQTPRLVGAGQTAVRSITTWCHGHLHAEKNLGPVAGVAWPVLLAVALVAAMTLCLIGVKQFVLSLGLNSLGFMLLVVRRRHPRYGPPNLLD